MAAPFEYEDLMEGSIKSLEAHNNKYDPTGKLNDLRLPPRRQQQAASRPKFYDPNQHTNSPYLSASLSAPSTLSLQSPYPLTIKLTHHPNPAGNPSSKPITFLLKDTALTEIVDTDIYPWLVLHHETNGSLKELDDGNHGPAHPSEAWGGNAEREGKDEGLEIREENGFVELGVGESKIFEARLKYTGEGIELRKGEKYSIAFRGSWLRWWRWGTLEALRGERKPMENVYDIPMIVIAATNLIEFTVTE